MKELTEAQLSAIAGGKAPEISVTIGVTIKF